MKWFALWQQTCGGEETSHGNVQRKTAQFIWLYSHRFSLSWEIGICIFCFQCQHCLPGTAALLGRALWWVENQRSTQELLITADRQIGFWRTTHGLSTLLKMCLGREYFTVSLTLSKHMNKLFRLFWHTNTYVWFISSGLWGTFPLKYEQKICFLYSSICWTTDIQSFQHWMKFSVFERAREAKRTDSMWMLQCGVAFWHSHKMAFDKSLGWWRSQPA